MGFLNVIFYYNPARLCLIHVLVLVAGLLQKLAKETECPICLLEMKERVFQCVSGRIIPVQGFNRTPVIDLQLTHIIVWIKGVFAKLERG